MAKLFEPIVVRGLEVRNRIWVPPMCEYSCENRDGVATDWHLVHLGAMASGGAGLIIAEATGVVPEGRISPWCPGIYNDEQVVAWRRVTDFVHSQGAKIALQLAHAGRKASTHRDQSGSGSVSLAEGGWQSVSATDEAFDGLAAPRKLESHEIPALVAAWGSAAARAIAAGFDAVEIHAAHGYLLHQFLSPLTNKRTDEYGGSLEGRAKFLLDVVVSIRESIPNEAPIFVRFSATDYAEGGVTPDEIATVAKWCAELGADLFDISTGGLITGVKIPTGPGYQVPVAEEIAEKVGQPVSAVGQITSALQAEQILEDGQIAVVMIGRQSMRDPHFALRAAHELGVDVDYWPIQYSRAKWPKEVF
jgi:2,4-dienoyl-CoA reductase-like NADH-dependent reductase (Old Yellow Enzyme family)